jgi:large subunit ribosomal protein L7/L12
MFKASDWRRILSKLPFRRAATATPAAEKTTFDIILKDAGDTKIEVIKVLRGILPAFGMKEIKDVIEAAPTVIRQAVPKEEAEWIQAKLAEVGATVEIK